MKKGFVARAMAGVLCASVAITSAQAKCWSEPEAAAAQLRDFETMLMVSALRCRLSGRNFLADYNRFVVKARPALTAANEVLRARMGLDGYDRYITSLANRYGAGADGLACRDMASILSAAEAERGSATGLARLARDAGANPSLSGGRCTSGLASRR
jgi:hypothetical protein